MDTVRTHNKGKRYTRDIPDGCFCQTDWNKKGYILKPDAKPAAWILMGDNYHEYAVFSADQVVPGRRQRIGRHVSYDDLEQLFEQYRKVNPAATELFQERGYYYYFTYKAGDQSVYENMHELSGHYDTRAAHLTQGSREKAYARLLMLIEKAQADKRD